MLKGALIQNLSCIPFSSGVFGSWNNVGSGKHLEPGSSISFDAALKNNFKQSDSVSSNVLLIFPRHSEMKIIKYNSIASASPRTSKFL